MKTLTSTLLAELGLTVTRPGYLVEIEMSATLRFSTLGDISYAGLTWLATDVAVRGLSADGGMAQNGTLQFGNADDAMGALILNDGIADRAIRVFAVYAGAPSDAVLLFDGVGDEASWDAKGRITVTLATDTLRTAFWPRTRINRATGFRTLMPAGTRLNINGQPYVLERR